MTESGLTPFAALIVTWYVPISLASAVPWMVAPPLPSGVNVRLAGRVPVFDTVAWGYPVLVNPTVFAEPATNRTDVGPASSGASFTVRWTPLVAFAPTPLLAITVASYSPPVLSAAVPWIVPEP